jgi:heterodisulfide reductase subunit C
MSCKTRCPRNNTPGMIIQALRNLSLETGLYMKSARGRQMYSLKKLIGDTILATGYCLHADGVDTTMFPEQGPIWDWIRKYSKEIYNRFGNSYNKTGSGALRKIPEEAMHELHEIFRITGTLQRFNKIENDAARYAKKTNTEYDSNIVNDYFLKTYTNTSENVED